MASGGQNQSIEIAAEKNVVIKATDALQDYVKAQNWGKTSTKERFKSAAGVLLRGLKKEDQDTSKDDVETNAITLTSLRADILEIGKHVAKTVKAAEIYLEVASDDADLKPELKALEKALMSSRRAEIWFEKSLSKYEPINAEAELSSYAASVDSLRVSANAYGDRVRERARALKAPAF